MISLKVPEPLLQAFRSKCEIEGVKYQTQIKKLMQAWLDSGAWMQRYIYFKNIPRAPCSNASMTG